MLYFRLVFDLDHQDSLRWGGLCVKTEEENPVALGRAHHPFGHTCHHTFRAPASIITLTGEKLMRGNHHAAERVRPPFRVYPDNCAREKSDMINGSALFGSECPYRITQVLGFLY